MNLNSQLKAVLFDLDGTLLYTAHANAHAYAEALAFYGYSVHVSELLKFTNGQHWSCFIPKITNQVCSSQIVQNIVQKKKECYKKYFWLIKENTQLISLLCILFGHFKLGLVTTASKNAVCTILKMYSWGHMFDVVITGDDVVYKKPHPEAYLCALAALGLEAQYCVSFEDSTSGIESAHGANIQVFRVTV